MPTSKKNNENKLDDFIQDENKYFFSVYMGRTFRKGPIWRGIMALIIGFFFIFLFFKFAKEDGAFSLLFLLFGLIGLIPGLYILFALDGVEINKNKKEIMEFVWFGTKIGTWKSINRYPYITVIKLHKITYYGTYVGTLPGENTVYGRPVDNDEFEICLLNETHHKRITIAISKNNEEAFEKANKLATILGVTMTDFNPVRISERKSRSRKK